MEARALCPTGGRALLSGPPGLKPRRTLGGPGLHQERQSSWCRPLDHRGAKVAGAGSHRQT
eukprot:6265333-Amphidinium_carterae.1